MNAARVGSALVAALVFAAPLAAQTPPLALPAWPPPPMPARIRYLRALDPQGLRRPPSLLSRVARVIIGSEPDRFMNQPYGIAVGSDRRVYVADSVGGTIHVYDVARSAYSTIKTEAESLIGIAVVGPHIVVTDSVGGHVICLDLKGRQIWSRGAKDGFVRPTGIAASTDEIYVVDTMQHRVVILGIDGSMRESFGRRGNDPGEFNFPTNIARASDGRLFVTDTLNFRVQVFDRRGRVLSTFGELGDAPGYFDKPKGVAVDSAGHVYVVEGMNDVVQIFDASGTLLLVFGGSGAGPGQLWLPSGIAIVNDTVYVADAANRRVQVFEYLNGRP